MTRHFNASHRFDAPVSELWAHHERPGAFERLNPPFDPVTVLERSGGLEAGARTVIELSVGPAKQKWEAVHTAYERERFFKDEQRSGPFAKWEHTHRFIDEGPKSVLEESIDYALPMGPLGELVAGGFTRHTLERMFAYRHQVLALDLARHAKFADRPKLTFAITGASGLVGSALTAFLQVGGHTVRAVKRRGEHDFDPTPLEGADVVVHLAGAGVGDERWSAERKRELLESRREGTRNLVAALGRLQKKPKTLLSSCAIGIYGDRGDEVLTETSAPGPAGERGAEFLTTICQSWEQEPLAAEALGIRVVRLRLGVVLSARGGALAKMLPAFKAGVAGPLAGGQQWMSWVCLEDVLGTVLEASHRDDFQGVFNVVAPSPSTNADFTKVLAKVLHRPAIAPVPAFALKTLFGEMAEGTVLPSQRVLPEALEAKGFVPVHPDLEQCLRFTLGASPLHVGA